MSAIDSGLALVVSKEGLQLVVTRAAATRSRDLGPVAWTALQVIALHARPSDDGRLVAGLSGREIAAMLGVGRDAANKAIAVLRDRALLTVEEQRSRDGRFRRNALVVNLPLLAGTNAVAARKARRRAPQVPIPTLFDTPTKDTETTKQDHRTYTDHPVNPIPPLNDTDKPLPNQRDALAFRNAAGSSDWEADRLDDHSC